MGRTKFNTAPSMPLPCSCDGPLVTVPPLPWTSDPKAERGRALVTVVVGREAQEIFSVTRPFMSAYADRVSADMIVRSWEGCPEWPMSAKFQLVTDLNRYDRILYVDADVLLRPGCADLFAACHPNEIGFVDELANHRLHPEHGREAGYRKFRAEMEFPSLPLPWYFNAGVMVLPASAREVMAPPTKPIRANHCSEQDWFNARVLESGHPYRLIDRRCNWMWWTDSGFRAAPLDAVLHFAGCSDDRVIRAEQIRQWAAPHYAELPQAL